MTLVMSSLPTDTEMLDWLQRRGEMADAEEERTGWICDVLSNGEIQLLQDRLARNNVREAIAAAMERERVIMTDPEMLNWLDSKASNGLLLFIFFNEEKELQLTLDAGLGREFATLREAIAAAVRE